LGVALMLKKEYSVKRTSNEMVYKLPTLADKSSNSEETTAQMANRPFWVSLLSIITSM
jgi:hypothetical protein